MSNISYTIMTRQSGLQQRLDITANNIANMSTSGFRAERVGFSEHIKAVQSPIGSLSMATANTRFINTQQGSLRQTGGSFDLAIEGDGYFMVQTPNGQRLTRAGAFTPDAEGALVTPDGYRLLDAGGAPVFIAPGRGEVLVASDGSLSRDGQLFGQISLVMVPNPEALRHIGGTLLESAEPPIPTEEAVIMQGFLEESNVNPIREITNMIEIQRGYELIANMSKNDDELIRQIVRKLGETV